MLHGCANSSEFWGFCNPATLVDNGAGLYMRKRFKLTAMVILMLASSATTALCAVVQDPEFNTVLFQTTFKIEGPGLQAGTVTLGTVFLMSRPVPETNKFRTVYHSSSRVGR